jgi:dTDP-4-dehydrorhamnose reductase
MRSRANDGTGPGMMRAMITGAGGQLGSTLVARLSATWDVIGLTRAQLDLADAAAVFETMTECRPDVVLNCAAYNDVEGAEDAAPAALTGNALGVRALAQAASATGATLVHYGTDFVFDGTIDRPYVETDPCRPLSTYGMSKLLGEWFALESPGAYVLRVESLFGGHPAKSSIDKILAAIRADQAVRVFADRTVTPSFVDDVASATEQLITPRASRAAPGIYHCVNSGVTTWLGVAEEIVRLLGRNAEIIPVKSTEVKLKARRPVYCALSNEKLRDAGILMPTWQDALGRYVG